MPATYIGRFAPSPTGPLHAGSLVAALASWLDARAHGGQWLVRIEDIDQPRCVAGMDRVILGQLDQCGLQPDSPPVWQSRRCALYQRSLNQLVTRGLAYPCWCSRSDILLALERLGQARRRHADLVYPGTCRDRSARGIDPDHGASAWRLRTDICLPNRSTAIVDKAQPAIDSIAKRVVHWVDRALGAQQQDVAAQVGDFVLKRADDCFTYQLAVVVDDAEQGVTDVVRGADLADNTARQVLLQQALGVSRPRYLHTPVVLGKNGEKLSKQNGAFAVDTSEPLAALNAAARTLGLPERTSSVDGALQEWVQAWQSSLLPKNDSSQAP